MLKLNCVLIPAVVTHLAYIYIYALNLAINSKITECAHCLQYLNHVITESIVLRKYFYIKDKIFLPLFKIFKWSKN